MKAASLIMTLPVFLRRETPLPLYQFSKLHAFLSQEMTGSALLVDRGTSSRGTLSREVAGSQEESMLGQPPFVVEGLCGVSSPVQALSLPAIVEQGPHRDRATTQT